MKHKFETKDVLYSSLELTKPEGRKNFQVSWGVTGFGFGQFYFYTDDDGRTFCDSETLKKETVQKIMDKFIDDIIFIEGRNQDVNSISDLEIIAIEKNEDEWRMECSNTTKDKAVPFLKKMIAECQIT